MTIPSFPGNELRERREALDLSVEDVYRKLRIPIRCIVGLEEDRLDSLPELCYLIGFLRTYCIHLDLRPEPYIDCLNECRKPTRRFLNLSATSKDEPERPPWLREFLAWGAVTALLILGWVTYAVIFQPETERSEGQVQADTVELKLPQSPGARE